MEKAEYFVYCDFFITHLWMERFTQMPKGEFLEVPFSFSDNFVVILLVGYLLLDVGSRLAAELLKACEFWYVA